MCARFYKWNQIVPKNNLQKLMVFAQEPLNVDQSMSGKLKSPKRMESIEERVVNDKY